MFMYNKRLQYTVRVARPNLDWPTFCLSSSAGLRVNWLQPDAISLKG